MMFAVMCSILIGSAIAAVTTVSPATLFFFSSVAVTTVSPATEFFGRYDTNKDGVITNVEFHKAAYTLDFNGDGNITRAEYTNERLGDVQPEVERGFDALDLNHDGIFDDKEISAAFNVFDGNGDGQMTPDEYLAGLSRVSSGHGASG